MPALAIRFLPHLGIAALLAITGLSLALKVQTGRLESVRRDLAMERALHETDLANVRAAQARANADWQTEIARTSQENRRLNDEADRKATTGSTVFVDRVMRLPPAPTNPGLSRASAMPGTDAAAGADRSSGDAVILARTDALICAANTARLGAAHDWAKELAATR